MYNKKKLKICDSNGLRLDSVVIGDEADATAVIKRWKRKGFL